METAYSSDEDDEVGAEEEESDEEDEHHIEHGDDADARWDEVHREWVLLPSADMFGKLYGGRVFGTVRDDRRHHRQPTFSS